MMPEAKRIESGADRKVPVEKTGSGPIMLTKGANSERRVRRISTTPYAVFVHSSPVYRTSLMTTPRRSGRPSARPEGRYQRHLPFRPDAYPYANRRWSKRLLELAENPDRTRGAE